MLGHRAQFSSPRPRESRVVVSRLTTKTHVSRILYELGAGDRAQLVMLAYESGLVVPGA
jgi:hypothetical protein